MRRVLIATALLGLLGGTLPAVAFPAAIGDPAPGYFANDNVEWLGICRSTPTAPEAGCTTATST
jgi:hypothetical protein